MTAPSVMMEAYRAARERGQHEGFVPMLVASEDVTLMDCLLFPEKNDVNAYRRKMLSQPIQDGGALFADLTVIRRSEAEEEGLEWESEIGGEMSGGTGNDRFWGMNNYKGGTIAMLLAEIPVKNPWEIFAWLPFGGWNECPDTPVLMAASKHWYEKYGAVPALMTHDVLEFDLPVPVSREDAMSLAWEQYVWCPDIVDQGCETVGALADTLAQSSKWYFWWD